MSELSYVLEVMGKPYTVRYSRSPVSNDSLMGRSTIVTGQIWIRADMEAFAQRQTLLHELIHAIADDCALDLSETQVSVIANGLASVKELRIELPQDPPRILPFGGQP